MTTSLYLSGWEGNSFLKELIPHCRRENEASVFSLGFVLWRVCASRWRNLSWNARNTTNNTIITRTNDAVFPPPSRPENDNLQVADFLFIYFEKRNLVMIWGRSVSIAFGLGSHWQNCWIYAWEKKWVQGYNSVPLRRCNLHTGKSASRTTALHFQELIHQHA